ncbi:MAG TPA: hypothetical protein VKK31_22360 [Thermoanaerobaculia bacterium]|nr:hypothetical protein [Thermoanaerobaculia bacterium]
MTPGPRFASIRRALIAVCCIAALVAILANAGGSAQAADALIGPDVTVFQLSGTQSYGSSGGFVGYSIGTTSCNRGDTPLNWCNSGSGCAPGATSEDHPVIAQNLYRLKNGRFEQIGMSWLKHGFVSTNSTTGGCAGSSGQSCVSPPAGGRQLGIGCTDPYGSSLNGNRPLGRRSEVNATSGLFPFPPGGGGSTATVYDQRVKVATADVDSALNPGALYFAEAQYIANDDAGSGNALNNASHRRVTVGAGPSFNLSLTGTFFEMQPAIFSWPLQDPTVSLVKVDVPGSIVERFHVARKVTDLGGGLWHYEYAVHNLNSDRSARGFTVEFPATANFTNVGFKDIEHHSGEPYATTDWTVFSSGGEISWSTDTFASNPNANALRWSTMFNFWFDADQPPTGGIVHTLDLFKPGDPSSLDFTIVGELFMDGFESGNTVNWSGITSSRPIDQTSLGPVINPGGASWLDGQARSSVVHRTWSRLGSR